MATKCRHYMRLINTVTPHNPFRLENGLSPLVEYRFTPFYTNNLCAVIQPFVETERILPNYLPIIGRSTLHRVYLTLDANIHISQSEREMAEFHM